jgi:hypothetical protein
MNVNISPYCGQSVLESGVTKQCFTHTHLRATLEKEVNGVISVLNRRTDDGEPVEDNGRLIGILGDDL